MKILGIDPGLSKTGWAVMEKNQGLKLVDYGCIETDAKEDLAKRLKKIYQEIDRIIKLYNVSVLAVEDIFFNTNAKTALLVGQARGVVILTAILKNLSVFSYTPLQVKLAITGDGKAEKQAVSKILKLTLKLKEVPKPDDAADAIAVALTYTYLNKY